MGPPIQSNEIPLQTQLVLESFERWGMDFMGPIKPPSSQKSYILVSIYYMMKWVEVITVSRATKEVFINFLFEIFVRYGLSRELIIDGGPQFTTHNISATLKKYHIKHRVTSLYHPQENSRAKGTNTILENILTKIVDTNR